MALPRRAVIWSMALGVPLLAAVLVAVIWGWDLLIPLVASRAAAALGRPITIAHLHIVPGRIVSVTADDVTIGNPPDWTGEPLARLPVLGVQLDAWALLRHGRLVVPLVSLDRPQLTATQLPNGAMNYQLQLAGHSDGGATIGEVRIADGSARVRLAKLRADLTIGVTTRDRGGEAQLVANARGSYNAQPVTAELVGGPLLALQDTAHPWRLDFRMQNGPTQVALTGTVLDPIALQGADLDLRLAGPDMALLSALTGLPIPPTPNYALSGRLDFADQRVQLRNITARVGSSDFEGSIAIDPKVEPPDMVANLTSRRVDLADLGGFIGAAPGRISTPDQSPEQRAQLARQEAAPKLIPDTPISVPKLHWANVHLRYRGQSILGRSVPLDNLDVVLDIVDGNVTLHPVSFGVGKGRIEATVELTPQQTAVHAKADVAFRALDVSRLMAATGAFQGAGTISGTGTLDATGSSLAGMLGTGRGGVRLAMAGGDLSAVLVNLSGLQFGKALLSALGMPERTQVECFVTDAGLDRGVLRIQALVLDTGEAIVTGSGSANLRDERIDMQLRSESKHFAIGSLPAPLNIGGTLNNPSIMPGAELAARAGAAAGVGVVFPPLALLPTIQFGTGDDDRCARSLVRAKHQPGGQRLPPAPRSGR